ncbi:MAG TPA: tripartite tricarboxylate transporter substrate binding protein [Xanthobacteraceae bacterium]|jgi:tripartite-type tricarboxylate transporter receptor subunit TctC|nr:tripartite tricarboxylate transporter substrate binding protein [Xanthobacteraceae bacterium]
MNARHIFAGCAIALAFSGAAVAQSYPNRPVTILTPFAAGSVTDAAARLIAQTLQEALGQSFVVENRAGAGGLLAAGAVARAKNDGYTLLLTTNSTHSVVHGLFKSVPYDPIKDFTPIARIGSFASFFAVTPDKPYQSMQALVAYAKANPGKLSYGAGNSTSHIVGEALKKRTGIDIVRVPYKSNPAVMIDLIGGQIPIMVADFNTGMPQLKAGKVNALAVLTRERNPALPDVPTLHETVMPGYHILAWAGMFGPAGMPDDATRILAAAVEKALQKPEVRARFASSGTDVYWSGPKEFDAFVKSELGSWTAMIKEAGIEPE